MNSSPEFDLDTIKYRQARGYNNCEMTRDGDIDCMINRIDFLMAERADLLEDLEYEQEKPIDIITHCTKCKTIHIDKGHWAIRKHSTHKCAICAHEWTPCDRDTFGVESAEEK